MNWKTSGRLGSIAGFGTAGASNTCNVTNPVELRVCAVGAVLGQTQDTIKSTAAEQRQLWRDVGDALGRGAE